MLQKLVLMSKELHTQIYLCLCGYAGKCGYVAELLERLLYFEGSVFLLLLGFLFLLLLPEA